MVIFFEKHIRLLINIGVAVFLEQFLDLVVAFLHGLAQFAAYHNRFTEWCVVKNLSRNKNTERLDKFITLRFCAVGSKMRNAIHA